MQTNKRNMIQCVICATVFTKDGYPNRFFNYDDRLIYGCSQCKSGDYLKHVKTTLVPYRLSRVKKMDSLDEVEDTGYLDYYRDTDRKIEGIEWEDLEGLPRKRNKGLKGGKPYPVDVDSISLKRA